MKENRTYYVIMPKKSRMIHPSIIQRVIIQIGPSWASTLNPIVEPGQRHFCRGGPENTVVVAVIRN